MLLRLRRLCLCYPAFEFGFRLVWDFGWGGPMVASPDKKCKIFQKSFALLFFVPIFAVPKQNNRGVAQLASASGLGPEGPVFESQYPDLKRLIFGLVSFFGENDRFCIILKIRAKYPVFVHGIKKTVIYDTGKRNRKVVRDLESAERD